MAELTVAGVRFAFAGLYALVFLGALLALARTPRRLRPFGALLAAVIGLAPLVLLAQQFGVGQVPLGRGQFDLADALRSLVTTPILYGGVAVLGGASRRLAGTVVGVAFLPIVAILIAPVLGASALAVGVLVAVTIPYPVLLYLYLRPVWATARELPDRRRLIHWKARNLLLFFYGMVLAFVLVLFAGLVTDPALISLLLQYALFFFYAGVPGFVLYEFAGMEEDAAADLDEVALFEEGSILSELTA